jgi:hypothetical protein
MALTFHVVVNLTHEHQIGPEDVDRLCTHLSALPVFRTVVLGERGYRGPTLDLIVESGRATVFFGDIERGIKLASQDEKCTQRGVVSLRNDAYPELELDEVEVRHRELISPARALCILRHYLTSGEVIDLVRWPPDDWDQWSDPEATPDPPGEEIAF